MTRFLWSLFIVAVMFVGPVVVGFTHPGHWPFILIYSTLFIGAVVTVYLLNAKLRSR